MQVEKRPAMARSNNGQWWCRRRFLRSVPRLAVLFDLKTRPPPHGPPPEPKPVRPAAPKSNIRTRNGGAGRRFLRAAKVEERPTMAKVRSSTANGGAGRSTANGGAGWSNGQRWCRPKILEGCEGRRFTSNGGAGRRFLRAAKVDDSWPTVVAGRRFLRAVKVDDSRPTVVQVKDSWKLQRSTIHDQRLCRLNIFEGCKGRRFTTNVGAGGASSRSRGYSSNIWFGSDRSYGRFWFLSAVLYALLVPVTFVTASPKTLIRAKWAEPLAYNLSLYLYLYLYIMHYLNWFYRNFSHFGGGSFEVLSHLACWLLMMHLRKSKIFV